MDELLNRFPKIKQNYPLSQITTLNIGGPAKYFIEIKSVEELTDLLSYLSSYPLIHYILGEGSNIVAPDTGFSGLVIKISIQKFKVLEKEVIVGAGNNLLQFINQLNSLGLSGMEKMAGIPGSVGGAIYGNAGAYGQETIHHLKTVTFLDTKGLDIQIISAQDAHLGYRTSDFKKYKNRIILEAAFSFEKGDPGALAQISKETIEKRAVKYPPGLKCPGSFFKNIVLANLPQEQRDRLVSLIDPNQIMYGKVTAGYLLEQVGAKGVRQGGIVMADYHANLLFNEGNGTEKDIKTLARMLKEKVLEKFGIELEEEVQYLD